MQGRDAAMVYHVPAMELYEEPHPHWKTVEVVRADELRRVETELLEAQAAVVELEAAVLRAREQGRADEAADPSDVRFYGR